MARPARLEYLVLLDSPDLEEARSDELEVTVRMRATDGGRFDEAIGGRAGLAVDEMPKWAQTEIARCQRYATICASVPEERARPIVEAAEKLLLDWKDELTWVLDCVTSTWRSRDEIDERPFSVEDHFLVVVEAVERAPGVGHLVRTRGLGKFARPDVGMRAPRSDAEKISSWVRAVGRRGAEGEPFLPGRRLTLAGGPPLALWPRTEDCLASAPADESPLWELREGGLSLVR
jgi:hypothetical protein